MGKNFGDDFERMSVGLSYDRLTLKYLNPLLFIEYSMFWYQVSKSVELSIIIVESTGEKILQHTYKVWWSKLSSLFLMERSTEQVIAVYDCEPQIWINWQSNKWGASARGLRGSEIFRQGSPYIRTTFLRSWAASLFSVIRIIYTNVIIMMAKSGIPDGYFYKCLKYAVLWQHQQLLSEISFSNERLTKRS